MTGRPKVLRLKGDLTVNYAAERKGELLAALEAAPSRLDLDLSAIEELDTAGLQLLLLTKREAARLEKEFRLVKPSAPVTDVLAIVRLGLDLEPAVLEPAVLEPAALEPTA